MSTRTERILLVSILMIAAVLRLYRVWDIPFTHDEFSALFRTDFQNFGELICKGVLPDFHPAGVQVFLYYHIQLTGMKEWAVKLPFIITGIGSVYLIFRIGKDWFNASAGLLSAAFMAVTQYFIFYSQMTRPYAPGLFFGLLAIFFWGKLMLSKGKVNVTLLAGWIFSAAICAYIHYYLLLTLVLLAIIGLFLIRRKNIPFYLLSGVSIALLYIPHFGIFFQQVRKGGVGSWLGKPTPDYIAEYFRYLFEFVPAFSIFILVMILIGILSSSRDIRLGKMWWAGVLLFALSLISGYVYSLKINSILQFSGLIFSVPLLLLSVFYFLSLKKWCFYTGLSGIVLFGVYGLIIERQHYTIFYESPYEEITKNIRENMDTEKGEPLILLDGRVDIMRFYLDKYGIDSSAVTLISGKDLPEIIRKTKDSKSRELLLGVTGFSTPEIFSIAYHYFPNIKQRKVYADGEFFHLSKDTGKLSDYILWQGSIQAGSPESPGYFNQPDTSMLSTDSNRFVFNDQTEYGLGSRIPYAKDFPKNENRFLDVTAGIYSNDIQDVHICTAIMENDSIVQWDSSPVINYTDGDSIFHAFHTLALYKNIIQKYENPRIKVFFWNRGREYFRVRNMKIRIRKGNPKLYGLYEDLSDG